MEIVFLLRQRSGWLPPIALALLIPTLAAAQTTSRDQRLDRWGQPGMLLADEEPPFKKMVADFEQEYRRTASRIAGLKKKTAEYLAGFWMGLGAEIKSAYDANPSRDTVALTGRWTEAVASARSAEGVYRRHLARVDSGQERIANASTRALLWYEHLVWLDQRNQAALAEYEMLESQLAGYRAAAED
jgi:hypothetical protein